MNDAVTILHDQRRRWAAGSCPLVEEVCLGVPDAGHEIVLDLICQEVLLREERGEAPSLAEYLRRFPELADDLRLHFEVHEALRHDPTLEDENPYLTTASRGPDETPPAVLPGYDLEEPLGRGGMGVVYAARQTRLDRSVAIKLLPAAAAADIGALRRFQREARMASALNHPHICTIYDLGVHAGQPFIVMERIVGRALAALVPERPPVDQVVRLVRQVAEALATAHASGIVHRDIKPLNIMVRDDGYVKVVDFGLARLMSDGPAADDVTAPGAILGTPRYMSPEQLRGESALASSDVFSLGIVFYELLTGTHPFARASMAETMTALQVEDPPPPSTGDADGSASIASLVLAMLTKRPEERPTSDDVARRLEGWPHQPGPPSTEASARPVAAAGGRERRVSMGLGVGLVCLAVGGGLWLAARTPGGAQSAAALPPSPPSPTAPLATAPAPRSAVPSIVVLPFTTKGRSDGDYFGEGVSEDITAMLARAPDISVHSYSAERSFAKTRQSASQVARELGVRYALEGSVHLDGGRVRLVAQLVDAESEAQVWSERFDESGGDPWALQDEMAGRIVASLTGEYGQIKRTQYRRAWGADSTSLVEYDYYLRGHEHYMRLTVDDNERAGAIWREGVARLAESALLQTKLGFHHFMRPFLFFAGDAATDYATASSLARGALATPNASPLVRRLSHWLFAYVSAQEGEHDRALRERQSTIDLSPYDAFALGDLSTVLILAGQTGEAIATLDEVIAKDPTNQAFYQQLRGWALTTAGRDAESLEALNASIDLPAVPVLKAINLVRLGRAAEARAEVGKALAVAPELTRERWRSANFYRDPAIVERQLGALAAAGLP